VAVPQLAQDRHAPRMMVLREACTVFYKTDPPPPHFSTVFARALGLLELSLGRNRGLGGFRRGFLGSFRERDSSLGNLSLSLSSFSLFFFFRDFGGFLE
jgi:hypothetical protein